MKETGTQDYTFDIGQVAANGLQEALQKLTGVMEKFAKSNERMEKALAENTCMVSKAVDAISRLKKQWRSMRGQSRGRKSTERRQKGEERRPGEESEDRKREERRWQQERRERGERRRAEEKRSEGKENKSETKQHEQRRLKGKRRLRKRDDPGPLWEDLSQRTQWLILLRERKDECQNTKNIKN